MKHMKHMKGLTDDDHVAARLCRARSVGDSDRQDLRRTSNGLVGSLSPTDRWAAAGGRHVVVVCQPPS
jgi:hypothetical protein